jgi:DNA photolyase
MVWNCRLSGAYIFDNRKTKRLVGRRTICLGIATFASSVSSLSTLSSSAMSRSPITLVWHRRDLRLHDNIMYHPQHYITTNNKESDIAEISNTTATTGRIASVFIIDPKDFIPRPSTCRPEEWDTIMIGPHSCRIMLESLQDLRQSLRKLGGDLWIRQGDTISTLLQLVDELQPTEICWQEEPGQYEQQRSSQVFKALSNRFPTLKIRNNIQYTLYHPDDLPLPHQWETYARPNQTRRCSKKRGKNVKANNRNLSSEQQQQQQQHFKNLSRNKDHRHSLVDLSQSRLEGMPRIMGDWRKAARTYNVPSIRPTLPPPDHILGFNYQHHQPMGEATECLEKKMTIDPGRIPTLTELYEPLLSTLSSSSSSPKSNHRRILGLSSGTIQKICEDAISQSKDNSRPVYSRGGEQNKTKQFKVF